MSDEFRARADGSAAAKLTIRTLWAFGLFAVPGSLLGFAFAAAWASATSALMIDMFLPASVAADVTGRAGAGEALSFWRGAACLAFAPALAVMPRMLSAGWSVQRVLTPVGVMRLLIAACTAAGLIAISVLMVTRWDWTVEARVPFACVGAATFVALHVAFGEQALGGPQADAMPALPTWRALLPRSALSALCGAAVTWWLLELSVGADDGVLQPLFLLENYFGDSPWPTRPGWLCLRASLAGFGAATAGTVGALLTCSAPVPAPRRDRLAACGIALFMVVLATALSPQVTLWAMRGFRSYDAVVAPGPGDPRRPCAASSLPAHEHQRLLGVNFPGHGGGWPEAHSIDECVAADVAELAVDPTAAVLADFADLEHNHCPVAAGRLLARLGRMPLDESTRPIARALLDRRFVALGNSDRLLADVAWNLGDVDRARELGQTTYDGLDPSGSRTVMTGRLWSMCGPRDQARVAALESVPAVEPWWWFERRGSCEGAVDGVLPSVVTAVFCEAVSSAWLEPAARWRPRVLLTAVPVASDGTFVLPGLPPGTYRLLALAAPGCASPVEVLSLGNGNLNVEIGPGERLRLGDVQPRVVDWEY